MTVPEDEQAQTGPGEFRDVVDVQLLDDSLALAARIARVPSRGTATVRVLVLSNDEPVVEVADEVAGVESWDDATAGPLRMAVEQPLERWTLSLDAQGVRVSLELTALTAPSDLADPATAPIARAAGLHRYTQVCEARGTAEIAGRSRPVETIAIRTHRWGLAAEPGRTRFLNAVTEDGTLLTVAALRPAGTEAHGEELIGGHTLRATDEPAAPVPFETVRLSTVFDEEGQPVKAGAELFRPGEELPRRLAGVAVGRLAGVSDEAANSLSLFRFGFEGVPALGSYEIEGDV